MQQNKTEISDVVVTLMQHKHLNTASYNSNDHGLLSKLVSENVLCSAHHRTVLSQPCVKSASKESTCFRQIPS